MVREPTQEEADAWEEVQADIAAGVHYTHHCYILTCGGDTYDPCPDAKEKHIE
jgi:hypothetical protein